MASKLKLNTVYNEDCLQTMGRMEDDSVDLTVTSPPYDDRRSYDALIKGLKPEFNGYSFPFEKIAKELYRVTKPGGVVVWIVADATVGGSETGNSFRQALFFKECGFCLHDTMVYQKPPRGAQGNNHGYWQVWEYMFVLTKGRPKTINLIKDRKNREARQGDNGTKRLRSGELKKTKRGGYDEFGRRTNVWYYITGKGHSASDNIAYKHPAPFPEKLALDHILSWSNEGDLVYDPFMGGGTTAKMCILTGRKWVGSELMEKFYKVSQERVAEGLKVVKENEAIKKKSVVIENSNETNGYFCFQGVQPIMVDDGQYF